MKATRRRYRFRDRATAEAEVEKLETESRRLRWTVSALYANRTTSVGRCEVNGITVEVHWFTTRHTALVALLRVPTDDYSPALLEGVYDCDETEIDALIYGPTSTCPGAELARLVDTARWAALGVVYPAMCGRRNRS